MLSPKPKSTTPLQKIIIVLFIVTIISSCFALILYLIEKPDKITTVCERSGGISSYKIVPVNFTSPSSNGIADIQNGQIRKNCTTTQNSTMSPIHKISIDIATYTAAVFFLVSAYAYATKKKEKPPEPPETQ